MDVHFIGSVVTWAQGQSVQFSSVQ